MRQTARNVLTVGAVFGVVAAAANWETIDAELEKRFNTNAETESTTTSTTTLQAAGSLTGSVVVLDPGHHPNNASHPGPDGIGAQVSDGRGGMKDCNKTGTASEDGYSEGQFNLDVAAKLTTALTNLGATVISTADGNPNDYGPCLTGPNSRAEIISRNHPAAAVSIHADGAKHPDGSIDTEASGFHIIVSGYNESAPSRALAQKLNTNLLAIGGVQCSDYIPLEDPASCLDIRDDLAVPNTIDAAIPLVTLESGNMKNPSEAARLADPAFQQQWAEAIAGAIEAQLTQG
ncbi:MAG TPA: N-acetylmuramoyl-L-alanine amidase [Candidatus Limnocylindria bacterium]|nr:N-acetylmuramoyl-L-alanine amidase [Candidatus Limnocylindria bacterium]